MRGVWTLALALLVPSLCGAQAASVREQVRSAVVEALGGAVQPGDVAVDPALKVAACSRPLVAQAVSARNVEVRCDVEHGWKVYVPIQAKQVEVVVVLTRPARAGVPLTADQLTLQQRDLASVAGRGYASVDQVEGKILRRGLPPGAVVLAKDLADAVLLKRGDPVTIQSAAGGIVVRVEGKALGNATLGGTVNVENASTRRIIRGRLVEEGLVQVGKQM